MKPSCVSVAFLSAALLSVLAGCSHQATPVASPAPSAHPTLGFAVKGPRAEPEPSPADAEPRDRQDAPVVDAMHGFSHGSPR
jgi:hypothetical protein